MLIQQKKRNYRDRAEDTESFGLRIGSHRQVYVVSGRPCWWGHVVNAAKNRDDMALCLSRLHSQAETGGVSVDLPLGSRDQTAGRRQANTEGRREW